MKYKVGDCVQQCIDCGNRMNQLTFGKKYKVIKPSGDDYTVILNDVGEERSYYNYRFKNISREEKLKRILNEPI